jgi:hypothetical protein
MTHECDGLFNALNNRLFLRASPLFYLHSGEIWFVCHTFA